MTLFVDKADAPAVLFFENLGVSVGKAVLVLNPEIVGEWECTTVIRTRDPLWPVGVVAGPIVDLPINVATEVRPLAFSMVANKVKVHRARMEEACSGSMCDGRNGRDCPCTRHKSPVLVCPCISFRVGDVVLSSYMSYEFSLLLFAKEELLASAASSLNYSDMLAHVKRVIEEHEGGFRFLGWVKPAVSEGDDFASAGKAHISRAYVIGQPLARYVPQPRASEDESGGEEEEAGEFVTSFW